MPHIDPDALATHLEVALMVAPSNAIIDLGHSDSRRRHRATLTLAHFLADRLGCFAISASELGDQAVPLFPELPNHAVR